MQKIRFIQLSSALNNVAGLLGARRLRVEGYTGKDGKDVAEMWIDRELQSLMVMRAGLDMPMLGIPIARLDYFEEDEPAARKDPKKQTTNKAA
jgi:hypothetical protein